jgi:hypothetical protein
MDKILICGHWGIERVPSSIPFAGGPWPYREDLCTSTPFDFLQLELRLVDGCVNALTEDKAPL